MSTYSKFVGRPYSLGKTDCYSIVRDYFAENYGLNLRNYARPERFWEGDLDLYKMFKLEGGKSITDDTLEVGDVLLMPLMTPFATHACIVVEPHLVLQHLPNRLSSVDPIRKWQSRATIVIRHPTVTRINTERNSGQIVQLHEVLDADVFRTPEFQKTVARLLGSDS